MGIIAKQSIQGTIVTYLGVAVGFVTTFFVLTRFLSAEEIGLARVLIDAATLFIGLAQLGTSSSIIRFYPHFKGKEQGVKSQDTIGSGKASVSAPSGMQLSFFQLDDPVLEQIRDEVKNLDINNLTPLEALNKLSDIKKLVGGK